MISRSGAALTKEVGQQNPQLPILDLSILGWKDKSDLLVVTFGEVADGQRTGSVKRQYWGKEGGLWKIFLRRSDRMIRKTLLSLAGVWLP